MGAKSKSGKLRGAVHKLAVRPRSARGRNTTQGSDTWEQLAQVPDERVDEIDCQRIVRGDGGRSLPLYDDDYN